MSGDTREFEDLASLHAQRVLGYLVRRSDPDTAAEVWQEVCLVAWRRLGDVPADESAALAWLLTVARRQLANHRRGERRRSAAVERLANQLRTSLPASSGGSAVGEALAGLGDDDQELVRLVYWDGLSQAQAATVLGISAAACRKRLERARRQLAHQLAVPAPLSAVH